MTFQNHGECLGNYISQFPQDSGVHFIGLHRLTQVLQVAMNGIFTYNGRDCAPPVELLSLLLICYHLFTNTLYQGQYTLFDLPFWPTYWWKPFLFSFVSFPGSVSASPCPSSPHPYATRFHLYTIPCFQVTCPCFHCTFAFSFSLTCSSLPSNASLLPSLPDLLLLGIAGDCSFLDTD